MISFERLGNLGRLGNSIFQAATAISLALDNNDHYVFSEWKYEKYFNLHDCFSKNIKFKHEYKEPFFHYKEIPYQSDMNLFGFFQSEKYFLNNKDVILGLLTPNCDISKKWNTTSIHVRHGDYLDFTKEYEQLQIDYYTKAMDMIKSKKYLVVSDDIEWCKRNFIGEQFEFSGADEITDLGLQISCEHNIIANSTFSWWGAYLNKNPSKIVIAPENWFGPALKHNTKDLIPAEWLKLDA